MNDEDKPEEQAGAADAQQEAGETQRPSADDPEAGDDAELERLDAEPQAVSLSYAEYQELTALASERDRLLKHLQRAVADYQNLQRRTEGLRESARDSVARAMAQEILPVLDGLLRALEAAEQVPGADGIVQGLRLVERSFYAALARFGIQPLDAVGQKFDPHYHEAAMQEPAEGVAPNTVIRELTKGFIMHDVVVRPSRVVVAVSSGPAPGQTRAGEGTQDASQA